MRSSRPPRSAFLGLGIQDPSPDWGLQVANARSYVQIAWWMAIFPALALSTLVVGVNLIADGIRRVLEERAPWPNRQLSASRA